MKALGIDIDLSDLTTVAHQAEEEMKKLAAEAMQEFITSYTKPVWPQEEVEEGELEEEDEEDEDDEEDEREHGDN